MKSRIELNTLLPANPIVAEIGCAEGLFSRDICIQWKPSLFYMVDNWKQINDQTGDGNFDNAWHYKNYNEAMERVAGHPVKVLRGLSWEMAAHVPDDSLDLVYLDACHMYECVKKDLLNWFPKLKKGGVFAGHDINATQYGVERAVGEFVGHYEIIPENGLDASFYFIK